MKKYSKIISSGFLVAVTVGVLISCDFIFEKSKDSTKNSPTQTIQNSQLENRYWVAFAQDNIKVIQLCLFYLNENKISGETQYVNQILDSHLSIKEEITNVANFKNISIPTITRKTPAKLNEIYTPNKALNDNEFAFELKSLLENQISTIGNIKQINVDKEIIESSLKIEKILLANLNKVDTFQSFKETYTNL